MSVCRQTVGMDKGQTWVVVQEDQQGRGSILGHWAVHAAQDAVQQLLDCPCLQQSLLHHA